MEEVADIARVAEVAESAAADVVVIMVKGVLTFLLHDNRAISSLSLVEPCYNTPYATSTLGSAVLVQRVASTKRSMLCLAF